MPGGSQPPPKHVPPPIVAKGSGVLQALDEVGGGGVGAVVGGGVVAGGGVVVGGGVVGGGGVLGLVVVLETVT